jgi:uncharacterized protein (TIGR00251 family)
MQSKKPHFQKGKTGSAIAVRIIPRAKRNEVSEIQGDGTVKIRITAPPIEGEANRALIRFLAKLLDIPEHKIEIVAGLGGRNKLVSIDDLEAEEITEKMYQAIQKKT